MSKANSYEENAIKIWYSCFIKLFAIFLAKSIFITWSGSGWIKACEPDRGPKNSGTSSHLVKSLEIFSAFIWIKKLATLINYE